MTFYKLKRNKRDQAYTIWGVKSLPWLILTDKEHVVTAEGFSLDDLNEKMTELSKK